jgi:gas vesicle protein
MSAKKYWLAFGIGVSAGAAVALLYAPQSGERTRKKLRRTAADAGDYLQDAGDYLRSQAERFSEEAQDAVSRAREHAVHLVDTAGDRASDLADSVSEAVGHAVKSAKSLV